LDKALNELEGVGRLPGHDKTIGTCPGLWRATGLDQKTTRSDPEASSPGLRAHFPGWIRELSRTRKREGPGFCLVEGRAGVLVLLREVLITWTERRGRAGVASASSMRSLV
jgi:hypothetical protein